MKFGKTITVVASLAFLTACGTAKEPSITAQDVDDAIAEYERLDKLSDTSIADIPTGTGQYTGLIGGNFTADSDVDGSFLGDLSLLVDFDSHDITGTADNINLIDDGGVPTQLLSGSLDVVGTQSGTSITATASGKLTGVEDGFKGSSTLNLNLSGDFKDDVASADTILGRVSGSGDGDFYIRLLDGQFGVQDK